MAGMVESVRLRDLTARVSSVARSTGTDGVERLTLVLVMPGASASRAVEDAVARSPLPVTLVDGEGNEEGLLAVVERAQVIPVGAPMSPTYRHQIVLRRATAAETPTLSATGEAIVEIALRLEALIDELERAGVVSRAAIDAALELRR